MIRTTRLGSRGLRKGLFLSALALLAFNPSFAGWFWQNPRPQGNPLASVYFVDPDTGYAVGESGTILKTTNGGAAWVEEEKPEGSGLKIEGRLRVAPNPFSGITLITCQLPSPGPVRLTVFNVSGQVVKVLASEPKRAGVYQTAWDGCDESGRRLPSGVYLICLEARSYRALRQVVLAR